MAYGFGTTSGAAATDKVATGYTTDHALQSYSFRILQGAAGGGVGRIFDKDPTSSHRALMNTTATMQFLRGGGVWGWGLGVAGSWYSSAWSIDTNNLANDPVAYANGTVATVTETTAPTSYTSDSNPYFLGNRTGGDRCLDGILAEFAMWSVLLDADEMIALTKGYSPRLIRPTSLVYYHPLIRDNVPEKTASGTVTGTVVQPHPRRIG